MERDFVYLRVCLFILLISVLCASVFANGCDFLDSKQWLDKGSFISKGTGSIKVSTGNNKVRKVGPAPEGSVYTSYEDVAFNFNDSFSSTTSTRAEAKYLLAGSSNKDNVIAVADCLLSKIHRVKVYDKYMYVISPAYAYNFASGAWEEELGTIYTEDLLCASDSLYEAYTATGDSKYCTAATNLSNSVLELQNIISKDDNSIAGALPYALYEDSNSYTTSWNRFPLFFSHKIFENMNRAYSTTSNVKFIESANKYNSFVSEILSNENFSKNGLPVLGIDQHRNALFYYEDTWYNVSSNDSRYDLIRGLETLTGLLKWDSSSLQDYNMSRIITHSVLNTSYLTSSGKVPVKSLYNYTSTAKQLELSKLLSNNSMEEKLLKTLYKSISKSKNKLVNGTWKEACTVNFEQNFDIIKSIN